MTLRFVALALHTAEDRHSVFGPLLACETEEVSVIKLGWGATFCHLLLISIGCGEGGPSEPTPQQPRSQAACLANAKFGDPLASPYCLPWAEGETFTVGQSYCSPPPGSHETRYAYDFLMPLGTEVRNVRAGLVVELREHFADDDRTGGHENMVSLRHDDSTISIYMHFQHDGVAVAMGDVVPQGALLGWSGATGDPAGIPHLHFQVCLRSGMCSYTTQEITLPVNFRNARGTLSPEGGLALGEAYTADACR